MEALTPPAQLSELHQLHIEVFRTVQAMYDRFPKDDVMDNAKMDEFLLAVAPDLEEKYGDLEEKLSEVAVRLPEHLRQQMIEVDCLNPDIVPDEYDDPDDHGNNFESATRIAIGEAVAIELEFRLDKDVLVFLAEPGTEYEFTLDWESYSRLRNTARPILALFDAGGQELARLNHYVFGSQDKMMWQAVTRGDYYIVVGDTVTHGSITLTVTDGEATEQLDRDDATVAPTHTPTPVPTPAAATLSLDEYLTHCAPRDLGLADDATFGDFSSLIAAEADRWEGVTPPAQLSEWHLLNIEGFRTIQALVDLQPKDDVIDFANFILIAAASADFEEKIIEAAARLPEDVRQPMIEAGCIDPEDVPDDNADVPYDYEDVPDDHGNDIDDATAIRVGADVRGELEYDGDIDYFRFQAEAGRSYQIDVDLGSLPDSVLVLLNPDGWELAYNDNHGDSLASRVLWEAPASGDYYLVVEASGFDANVGTYTLTVSLIIDDHGNSEGDATAIRVGADVRGELEYDGDFDFFRFQAEAGWSYQIDVALGTLDDSIVELYAADGSFLDANDDYGNTYASRLSWRASSSGERYVFVGGYGIGTYTLTVSIIDDHGNDFASATRIAIGEAVAVELEHLDDMDVLVFLARPGTDYVVTLDWETYQIWDNPGSIMALYDAGGRLLARLNDYDFSAQRIRNKIMWRAVTGGDYYIVIGDENTLGTFTLTVTGGEETEQLDRDDHSNDIDDATVAAVAVDVKGVIDYEGDIDYFRFTAEEGQLYQIDVALGTLDDSVLELLGPDRRRLAFNGDHGDSPASRIFWEAPASGDYYLVVESSGFDDVGTYTLTVSHVTIFDDHGNDFDDATVAAVGADVRGALDYDGDIDYFRFTAEEGQLYQIDVALGTLDDSALELLRADGWRLAFNRDHGDSQASRIVWEAPASGDYYLVVEAGVWNVDVGNYTLTVSHSTIVDDHGNDIDDATVAAVGVDVAGVIDYEGDADYFRFTAEEGQLYQIDVALGTLDDSVVNLYDGDGWFLDFNDNDGDSLASRIFWEAPSSGERYVAVEGYGIGTYTLTVTRR